MPGKVIEGERLTTLAFLWDPVRLDLTQTDAGTTLSLAHTFDDRNAASSYAAGWPLGLGAVELVLAGKDAPTVGGHQAMEHGWPELNQQYSEPFRKQV